MSFDKKYPNRKDWRKQYYDSRRVARSCRCHKGCGHCLRNRLYQTIKRKIEADYEE